MTIFLMAHGIMAVLLLGAVTHQALAAWWPARTGRSFFASFRAVRGERYANAIILLFLLTFVIGGMIIYPPYRLWVRPRLSSLHWNATIGVFELKEHFITMGLGLLPAYWYYWKAPQPAAGVAQPGAVTARNVITLLLALFIWYSFIAGHFLNDTRGLHVW